MTAVIIPTLDPDSEMCRAAFDSVTATCDAEVILEHDRERAGFAETCNAAANRTTADLLVFLNDDCLCTPGWLTALRQTARNDPESAAIVGSRLIYPDGRVQHSGVFLRRDPHGLTAFNRRTDARSAEVPAVTGACLMVERACWDDLGGFDESFVNGYEDVDFCLRARRSGATVRYCAESTVVHLESQSPGRFAHAAENVALLNERWLPELEGVI